MPRLVEVTVEVARFLAVDLGGMSAVLPAARSGSITRLSASNALSAIKADAMRTAFTDGRPGLRSILADARVTNPPNADSAEYLPGSAGCLDVADANLQMPFSIVSTSTLRVRPVGPV